MNDGHQKAQEAQKDLVFVRFVPFGGYPPGFLSCSQTIKALMRKAEWLCVDGLYLDQPKEWDDPYRFFRW